MAEVGYQTERAPKRTANVASGPGSNRGNSAASEIRTLGRHTAVYALGVGISRLAGFIMLPIYTRFLTPADYGVLELLTMTIDLISYIVGIGISSSVFKFYAEAEEPAEKDRIVSTAGIAVLGLAGAGSLLGMLCAPLLGGMLLQTEHATLYFRLFFGIYLLQTAESIPMLLLRARHKSGAFVSINVLKLVAMLSLNICFVVVFRFGVLGMLLSNLIASAVSATALTTYLFRQVGFHFHKPTFARIARFGAPLVPWFIANFLVSFSDRYFVNHYVGAAGVGIYSLAAKFVFVLSAFAFNPFQMIWDPQRFAIAKRADAGEIYRRVFFYLNLAMAAIGLMIGLFVFDAIRVIAAPSFRSAASVVPLLLAAQIIFHWAAFSNFGLLLRSKTHGLAVLSIVGIAAVLTLNFLLIPTMGVQGAALASLLAYSIRFLAVYLLSQRYYRIAYPWGRIARLYGTVGAALLIRQLVNHQPVTHSLLVSGTLAVATLAAIYMFVLSEEERGFVKRVAMQPRFILSFGSMRA